MNPLRLACVTAGLLVLAACSSGEPTITTPEPSGSQRIVFVGPQFDIWTVQGDGGSPERLTGGGGSGESGISVSLRPQQAQSVRYTWPTWSPDGRLVALSRTPSLDGNAVASLVLLDAAGSTERQLHETLPGSVGLVANGAPHYALWAPDSQFLSFVAPRGHGRGLGLFAVRPSDGEPYEVAANAPLYHIWSPDGRYILVHRREQLLLHDVRDRSTRDLEAESLRYRVPAFSPDGERIAYVVDEGRHGEARHLEDRRDRPCHRDGRPRRGRFRMVPNRWAHRGCDKAGLGAVLRFALHRGRGRLRARRAVAARRDGRLLLGAGWLAPRACCSR